MDAADTFSWIWQNQNWPSFTWDEKQTAQQSSVLVELQNKLLGNYQEQITSDLEIDSLLTSVLCSSEIEGEHLDARSVRSSLAKTLGLADSSDAKNESSSYDSPAKIKSDGLARIAADVHLQYADELHLERLFSWHKNLFPSGSYVDPALEIGSIRKSDDMKIVSGSWESPNVHFIAPTSDGLHEQMANFVDWYNQKSQSPDADLFTLAAVAHLWFLTLHPFDDGNGRIARVISDLTVVKQNAACAKLYSISEAIAKNKKDYYSKLEATQKGGLVITPWILWFGQMLEQALNSSIFRVQRAVEKTNFWQNVDQELINDAQKKAFNKLLDSTKPELVLTNKTYKKITKVSKATATRHLAELVSLQYIVKQSSGGRSVHYVINKELL